MKRSICFCILFLLFVSIWLSGPMSQESKALTIVNLKSPVDSTKVTIASPTFVWDVKKETKETPKRYHIKVADNPAFTNPFWEDTTNAGTGSRDSTVYPGTPPLTQWHVYYWTVRVEVDSETATGIKTYWQEDFATPFIFYYTTAKLFRIKADGSGDLPTIQEGIIWAAKQDTVLVEPGIYYENLRFYSDSTHNKDSLIVTSNCCAKPDSIDTLAINRTIIDGSHLTRGTDKGSVVFFSANVDRFGVDSTIQLMGFTIRGGKGTLGADKKINGGGIYCDAGSSPTIAHNVITNNQTEDNGGGIFINSATPNILHNIITNNSAVKGSGGGIECAYSIEVEASASSSSDNQGGGSKETSSTSSDSRLRTRDDDIKNSLNPKDATEASSALTPGTLAKSADNNPPVAVFNWYARKNTIIQRDKYLVDDTLFFEGTASTDPDSGDSIASYQWQYIRYFECQKNPSTSFLTLGSGTIYSLPITPTTDKSGVLTIRLRVFDTSNSWDDSDPLTFNIQYPPRADAGKDTVVGPAGTAWLNGVKSCDVNPGDFLTYHWSQDSGAISVTIVNADSAKAYFVAQDTTYVGKYKFQLMVTDSIDTAYDTLRVTVARAPVALCKNDTIYGDTLVGFTTSNPIILDASLSSDPNPGGQVKYYIWEPAKLYFATKSGVDSFSFTANTDSNLAIQPFTPSSGGGLYKFRLKVRNSYGVISQNQDSVLFSVEQAPYAIAGQDTLVTSETYAYLTGSAIEINPDQRNSLIYYWSWLKRPAVSIDFKPADTLKSVYFGADLSAEYIVELRVGDGFLLGERDTVKIVANKRPIVHVSNVAHAFEGDTAFLNASASYDPDSADFQQEGSSTAGGLKFNWSVKSYPPGAESPVIMNADKDVAKFIPYGTGIYEFWVLVNDTLSVRQPPDSALSDTIGNLTFITVTIDSTYAYPIIQGNLISHNFAGEKGGGIDCNKSSPDIINNIFFRNQSQSSGGAISCRNFSTPQIKSNIFFSNISSDSTGGAIADLKGQLSPSATRGFRKSLGIKYNDFWDNRGGTLHQASGTNNIYTFPRLIDPDFGDFRLECTSPCKGAGDTLHPDIGSLIYFQPCGTADVLKMVSLSLFQNPVATAVAHFLVNTDAPLKAPPVAYVTMGDHAPGPVYFTPISSNAYRGSYVFSASGTAHISVFASSLLEKDTIATRDFGVQFVTAGKPSTLLSSDKKVGVLFPEGAVKEGLYATCISVSADPQYQFEERSEMVACGDAYQVGPSISFEKDLIISFPLDGLDLKDKDKTCFLIHKYEDGKWNQLQSFLEGNSVCTKVKNLGVYRLIYDPRAKHITGIPKTFDLFQNHPNPFNPETQIRYDVPVPGRVKLTVYNVLGQKVKVLVDEIQDAGYKSVNWDGKDAGGQEVASGIYFYKIEAQNYEKTRKMVLLK